MTQRNKSPKAIKSIINFVIASFINFNLFFSRSNMSSNKKIDNAIYKKSFLAFFKEIFFELYPNHKTINNEKYQNFKNFYYNIKFFLTQSNKEDYQNKWEHYLSDIRMINELKKQQIKNTALTMLIKALETDSEKIDLPALFVEVFLIN